MKIDVRVKIRSKDEGVELQKDGSYTVSLNALAEKNKANLKLIAMLAKHFEVPKSRLKIVLGEKSRRKVIEVTKS